MTTVIRQGNTRVRIFSPRGAHLIAMFARTEKAKAFRRFALDVLEGLGGESGQEALPAPAGPSLSREIRSAIDRKAHEVSLRAYESAKAQIEAQIEQRRAEGQDEEGLMDFLYSLSYPRGERRMVGADSLWRVTSGIAALHKTIDGLLGDVHALERETGREWWRRS